MDMASSDIRLETKKRTIHGNALGLLAWLQKRNICSRRPCVDKKPTTEISMSMFFKSLVMNIVEYYLVFQVC